MPARKSRPLEWAASAFADYRDTLARIADDDPLAATNVRDRVERSLALIAEFPAIGTPATVPGYRRYPVARTGHVLAYRATRRGIVVMQWYRARRDADRNR